MSFSTANTACMPRLVTTSRDRHVKLNTWCQWPLTWLRTSTLPLLPALMPAIRTGTSADSAFWFAHRIFCLVICRYIMYYQGQTNWVIHGCEVCENEVSKHVCNHNIICIFHSPSKISFQKSNTARSVSPSAFTSADRAKSLSLISYRLCFRRACQYATCAPVSEK